LFAGYLVVVGFGVFGPDPSSELDQAGRGLRKVESEFRAAVPGGSGAASSSSPEGPEGGRVFGGLRAEDVGNVAMFVPFGVLFPVLWPLWRWWTIPTGVTLSGSIEFIQLAFLPHRSPTLSDIGWNGLGAVMGFGLWLAGAWLWSRRPEPLL